MNSTVRITDKDAESTTEVKSMMEDPLIRYEVALEIIWSEIGEFMQAEMAEERKEHPNKVLLAYYAGEGENLRGFDRNLRATNKEAIDAILDRKILRRATNV
ncbi:MAG: hypothetical protein LBU43_01960 [Candidatus Accumulibacter sp.]|jgi:hypothetical protein|nr:hypothetical protein [Accumulibacter sp.]